MAFSGHVLHHHEVIGLVNRALHAAPVAIWTDE